MEGSYSTVWIGLLGRACVAGRLVVTWCDSLFACFFFFTLVSGPRRSLSLTLGDTRIYEMFDGSFEGGVCLVCADRDHVPQDLQVFSRDLHQGT